MKCKNCKHEVDMKKRDFQMNSYMCEECFQDHLTSSTTRAEAIKFVDTRKKYTYKTIGNKLIKDAVNRKPKVYKAHLIR